MAAVASILKLNQQTVRNWIDSGKLPALRTGGRVRIRCEDFDARIESSAIGQAGKRSIRRSISDGESPAPRRT